MKDSERRAAYDQLGSQWQNGEEFTPPPGWSAIRDAHHFNFSGTDFGDFFDSVFGASDPARNADRHEDFRMRGSDQTVAVAITLEDSYYGRDQIIELRGTDGPNRQLKFSVPQGISAGQHVRLAGQGMAGYGGEPAGDLLLEISLLAHRDFTVDGRNIHAKLPITPWEAALGATVEVETLGGKLAMTVKPGVQVGQKLRLGGRGLPGSTPGDHIVEIALVMPPVDSDAKRELFEQMRETMAFNPRSA